MLFTLIPDKKYEYESILHVGKLFQNIIDKCLLANQDNKNKDYINGHIDELNLILYVPSSDNRNNNNHIYTCSTGPSDTIIQYDKSKDTIHYISLHSGSSTINLHFEINKDRNYRILYASETHRTKDGYLIGWKGAFTKEHEPCLMKIVLYPETKMMQNEHSNKFRCNLMYVENIYKIIYQSCSECKKWAIYKYGSTLYCKSHARSRIDKSKTSDGKNKESILEEEEEEEEEKNKWWVRLNFEIESVSECFAPFQFHVKYEVKKTYNMDPFDCSMSKCDQRGYYFFFDQDLVPDYVFYECKQPLQNLLPLNEEMIHDEKENKMAQNDSRNVSTTTNNRNNHNNNSCRIT